jgi:hypothetical protein
MRAVVTFSFIVALAVGSSAALRAHHAFAAEFDANAPVEITGTITKLDWVNPHGWIYMDVKKPNAVVEHWEVETGGPGALLRRGVRRTDFPIGIDLVAKGYMSKRKPFVMNASTIKKTDGTEYFVGSSGTGAPEPPPTAAGRGK